jgi:hypothetical protein
MLANIVRLLSIHHVSHLLGFDYADKEPCFLGLASNKYVWNCRNSP